MTKNKKSRKIKKQKMYKMRGCSRKNRCKNYLGGMTLAYPSDNVETVPNPHLAYTGKGGSSCPMGITPANATLPENINAQNPAYPNTGPLSNGFNFLNSSTQRGGSIFNPSCKTIHVVADYNKTGGCGEMCPMTGSMTGGSSHRSACKCSSCKSKHMKGGNAGIPYPNGLTGNAYTPGNVNGWPGVNGIQGDSNHFALNTYKNDVSRQMIDLGPAPPFTGMKGGSKKSKSKSKKGGGLTNFLFQDLVNLGRQFQFNLGSAYNGLQGYSAPVNPAPWKDQLVNTNNLAPLRALNK